MHCRSHLLAAALASAAIPAAASPFTPAAAIDAAVAGFLGATAGAPGGAARGVDPRLKLASCPDPLAIEPYGRSGTTLQVSCPARGWRIFVPVNADGARKVAQASELVVQKGETVALVYEGTGFVLTRQGEALEAGAQEQWIKIKPVGENTKPIRGQIVRPGIVRVTAG